MILLNEYMRLYKEIALLTYNKENGRYRQSPIFERKKTGI